MAGAKINEENSLVIVRRLNSIGFFDLVYSNGEILSMEEE